MRESIYIILSILIKYIYTMKRKRQLTLACVCLLYIFVVRIQDLGKQRTRLSRQQQLPLMTCEIDKVKRGYYSPVSFCQHPNSFICQVYLEANGRDRSLMTCFFISVLLRSFNSEIEKWSSKRYISLDYRYNLMQDVNEFHSSVFFVLNLSRVGLLQNDGQVLIISSSF